MTSFLLDLEIELLMTKDLENNKSGVKLPKET